MSLTWGPGRQQYCPAVRDIDSNVSDPDVRHHVCLILHRISDIIYEVIVPYLNVNVLGCSHSLKI